MPRPKTKEALIKQSDEQYEKLISLIQESSHEELVREFPEGYLNRNVRDVIAHLHEWHKMFINWYTAGMNGDKPEMPARGYSWKTTPDLNRDIQMKYCIEPFEKVLRGFKSSHAEVMNIIHQHNNDELFEKKRYQWTGSTSLGAYLVSTTSSHYDWALKLIKKCRKQMA